MNNLLLRLLGVSPDDVGSVVGLELDIQPALGGWLVGALVVASVLVAFWSYRRRDVELTRGQRGVLLALRLFALLGIAGILLRPGVGLVVEGLVRQTLLLLVDESASLNLRDPRTDTADQVRAAIAAGRLPPGSRLTATVPPGPAGALSRLELLQAVLTNRELAIVDRLAKTFDLRAVGFAGELLSLEGATDLGSTNSESATAAAGVRLASRLRADGRVTALGTALREVLDREQGRPLGGVIAFTDGIRNAGADPREAANLLREAGVTLHTVGLGTTLPRDLQVVELSAPEAAFVREEIPVSVRLRGRGLGGQNAEVALQLDGLRVDARSVTFDEQGEVTVAMRFTPERTGDYELSADLAPRQDEILTENNRITRRLRVMDDRIRVLFLEQSPRWEFRYLQALLLRDRRVELKCVLFDGDPAIARGPASPYLSEFPSRREELFAYDLIVFGDVDPRNFTPAQLEILSDFVARSGGAFLMVAGRRFSPWGYRDTPLERLLPVHFDRVFTESPATAVYDQPHKVMLTAVGRESPLLRMSEDEEENVQRWQALPPLYWLAPVGRAKPAARVLVAEPGPTDDAPGTPVIALQQYGVGESMFIGTDNTWRWRRNAGEDFFVGFWGRVVQRLAIRHLVSGSRRTQLLLDRVSLVPGDRLGVTARLFSSAFEPLTEPLVRAEVEPYPPPTNGPLVAAELSLRAVPDQPGLYQGEWVTGRPGRFRLRVGADAPATADFTVEDRLVEAGETAMQEPLLRELASSTGGEFFREETLDRLPEAVRSRAQRVRSRLVVDLWSSPLYFLLVLGFLTVEWGLRKWWHLK